MPKLVCGIFLPDDDEHFAHHLTSGPMVGGKGTYQLSKIERALKLAPRHRHAVDVGAHVGLWSRILALYFDRVTAFEPVARHVECFRLNLADSNNVLLHQVALGAEDGELRMAPAGENTGNAHVDARGSLTVPVKKLDSFELGKIDLLKIDVEGFERFVLDGGEQTIRRTKPVMVIEQKPGNGERYGLERTEAVDLVMSWGAEIAETRSGDYFLTW
jgi:FkbM family methyltransferase